MKLHGAIQFGSTSVLLNNIDTCVKKGENPTFLTLKNDLQSDSSKPVFWQFIITLPGKLYAKIEKKLLNRFGANGLQLPNLTLPTLTNDH